MVGRLHVVCMTDRFGRSRLETGEVVDCNCSSFVEYVVEVLDCNLCNFLIPRNLLDGDSGSFVGDSMV